MSTPKASMSIKAGTLVCVDHGEYSAYNVLGFFVALQDFKPLAKLKGFLKTKETDYYFQSDEFLASLIAQGLLLEIEYYTLFLGAYANADSVGFTRPGE